MTQSSTKRLRQKTMHGTRRLLVDNLPIHAAIYAVVVASFLATMLLIGGATLSFRLVAAVTSVGFIVALTGDRLLVWLKVPQTSAHGAMAIVTGTAVTSVFVVTTGFFLGITNSSAFLLWSAVVLVAVLCDRAFSPQSPEKVAMSELGTMVLLAALVAVWT